MDSSRRGRVTQLRIAESIAATLRERILGGGIPGNNSPGGLGGTASGGPVPGSPGSGSPGSGSPGSGDGRPGDGGTYRLPTQDQLVQEFGVSYPSVREAIRILETEGLVTVRRGNVGGAEVHRPDSSFAAYHLGLTLQGGRVTLGDLAAGLRILEPLCAGECARDPDRHDKIVPALRANIDASAGLVGAGAPFTRTAREFHELVVAFTPNATVRHVVSSLVALWSAQEQAWAEALTSRGEYPAEEDAEAVVRTHRRLLKEIVAGRAAAAERIARAHLAATQALIVERFDDGVVNAALAKSPPPAGPPYPWQV